MTIYTAAEANQLIIDHPEDYATKASFLDLVGKISVEANGSVTLLYGESMGQNAYDKDVNANKLITQLVNDGTNVRVINRAVGTISVA